MSYLGNICMTQIIEFPGAAVNHSKITEKTCFIKE